LIAAFIFVLWTALSVLWSADPRQSMRQVFTWAQSLALVLILWDVFRTRTAILAGLQAYVLGAYVAVGGAIANYFGSNPFYSNYDRFSPGATNPDGFGFIIALGIPVAWYLASSVSTARSRRVYRAANLAFIPLAFLGLALSGTRTAAIAAVVGMAFGLASLTRLRPMARIAILAVLLYAFWALLPVVQPLASFQRLGTTAAEATQGDLNGRLQQWRTGLAVFSEHPVLGVGANMYRSVNDLGKVAHNSFISVLVELGLIGIVLFGVVLVIAVVHALSQPTWDRNFWITVLLVWAIGASTLTWEDRKTTWLFLTLLVASAALASRNERVRRPARAVGRLR
jgi:O-antigen ligase